MKSIIYKLLALTFIIPGFQVEAREMTMKFKGFELMNCNAQKKCVIVKSKTAESGNFSPLIVLLNVEVIISQNGSAKVLKGNMAHYSMESNKIVLNQDSGSELEINLVDLSEKTFN